MWNKVRPWIGVTVFLYEVVQPLFGYKIDYAVLGGAIGMMSVELISRADKNGEDQK